MAMITNDWLPAVREEFAKPYYRQLYQFVKEEYSRTVVYPPAEDIFNALHFTPLSEVKVLILGQDPYHNEHQAHGLSFSVLPDQKEIPPSLQNIYKELQDALGITDSRAAENSGTAADSEAAEGSSATADSTALILRRWHVPWQQECHHSDFIPMISHSQPSTIWRRSCPRRSQRQSG